MLYHLQTGYFQSVFLQIALSSCVTPGRDISKTYNAMFGYACMFLVVLVQLMISPGTEADGLQTNGGNLDTNMHVPSLRLNHGLSINITSFKE